MRPKASCPWLLALLLFTEISHASPPRKVFFYGIDGFPFGMVSHLQKYEHKYPALNQIFKNGRVFRNKMPAKFPESPERWTTLYTGVSSSIHGVESFYKSKGNTLELYNARDIATPTFWKLAGQSKKSVGIIQFMITHPASALLPESAPGSFVISDRLSYLDELTVPIAKEVNPYLTQTLIHRPMKGAFIPESLERRILEPCNELQMLTFEKKTDVNLANFTSKVLRNLPELKKKVVCTYFRIEEFTQEILSANRKKYPDLLGIYDINFDVVSHILLKWDPNEKVIMGLSKNDATSFISAIDRILQTIEKNLETVLKKLGPNDIVFLVSDHGIHANMSKVNLPSELLDSVAIVYSKGKLPKSPFSELRNEDIAPLVLDALGVTRPKSMKPSFLAQ